MTDNTISTVSSRSFILLNSDLSAFYFEIRKDRLYCDAADSVERRACRTVMKQLFDRLTAWLAPILCFTAEEAWQTHVDDLENSVHLRSYDPIPSNWANNRIAKRWDGIRRVRQVVMSALENARNEGKIGSSLQAALKVYVSADVEELFDGLDAASLFITSAAVITNDSAPEDAFKLDGINDVAIAFAMADGEKWPVAGGSRQRLRLKVTSASGARGCRGAMKTEASTPTIPALAPV